MHEEEQKSPVWVLAQAYPEEKADRELGALTRSSYSADPWANTEKAAL